MPSVDPSPSHGSPKRRRDYFPAPTPAPPTEAATSRASFEGGDRPHRQPALGLTEGAITEGRPTPRLNEGLSGLLRRNFKGGWREGPILWLSEPSRG
jgi:hypothetical protein